jgi:cardiolipin synthase
MEVSIDNFNIEALSIEDYFTTWSVGDFAGLGLILHVILMIVMTLRIVSVQRNIGVSIAWVAVLYTLPLVGFIAYILLGEPMIGHDPAYRLGAAQYWGIDCLGCCALYFAFGWLHRLYTPR